MLGTALLLLLALGLRLWHDRRVKAEDTAENVQQMESRARAHPDDLEAQLDWGIALQRKGRLEEAETYLSQAARIAPQDARPFAWLGLLELARNRVDQAKSYLRQATLCAPSDPDVLAVLGELHSRLHENGEAIAIYERLTQLRPKDPLAWQQLSRLYAETDQWARGYDAVTHAAALNPVDLRTQRYLGKIALTLEHYSEAGKAYAQVLANNPDDPSALTAAAMITLRTHPAPADLDQAQQQIERALALRPSGTAYLVRGQIHLAQRQYSPAIADFKAALARAPHLSSAYAFLSQAYAGAGQPALARQAAQRSAALALQPHSAQPQDDAESAD